MTPARFEANVTELMRLDKGAAKLIILGRDTAFQDEYEFRSIILGRQRTSGGQDIPAQNRRSFRQLTIRDFAIDEAKNFVRKFFPVAARDAQRGSGKQTEHTWIIQRCDELTSGTYDDLLSRPVHARMLCQIATDPDIILTELSQFGLFDRFVHFLLDREVKKNGRDPRFSLEARRRFNRALAYWLWAHGGVSTVTIASIPSTICNAAAAGISHDYDDQALRKELVAGCLIEKGETGTIYFGHRSLQEFLVAEELIHSDVLQNIGENKNAALTALDLITHEIGAFILEAVKNSGAVREVVGKWFDVLVGLRHKAISRQAVRFFVDAFPLYTDGSGKSLVEIDDAWSVWINYFSANGGVEFKVRTNSASRVLDQYLRKMRSASRDEQAATISLLADVLQWPANNRETLAQQFIGVWLDADSLRQALSDSRKQSNNEHLYITVENDLRLWSFLSSSEVSSSPPAVKIDLRLLKRKIQSYLAVGFTDESDEPAEDALQNISIKAQDIYRAWQIREHEVEKIRPYFGNAAARAKILPLEVVRTQLEPSVRTAEKTPSKARSTISLKKQAFGAPGKNKGRK